MLSFDPARIIKMRGITEPFAWLRKKGFSHHTSNRILHGKFSTLKCGHIERLCHLLKCTVHDMLSYTPGPGAPPPAEDTLTILVRQETPPLPIATIIEKLPLDRLQSLTEELTARLSPPKPEAGGQLEA
ncbi:MAG: helix-turn-helix domain-containing protein [Flavobacteriales bacterium]|nr:helix-turn-helix domain-containing protein [Flavobacteriales bacterium]MBP6696134.1 helix-turn-helix domain-containing protein [Flavobacteriales bacterium]